MSAALDDEERELRMAQMRVNTETMQHDMRHESRNFLLRLAGGMAAAVGAGVALGVWLTHTVRG